LIAYGAKVDAQNDEGQTPLHSAVLQGNVHFAKVLLKHGAKLDIKDADRKTALMLARDMHPDLPARKIGELLKKHEEWGGKLRYY
jgi:ankyrin repeat protein